jgi:hypothetical protein
MEHLVMLLAIVVLDDAAIYSYDGSAQPELVPRASAWQIFSVCDTPANHNPAGVPNRLTSTFLRSTNRDHIAQKLLSTC